MHCRIPQLSNYYHLMSMTAATFLLHSAKIFAKLLCPKADNNRRQYACATWQICQSVHDAIRPNWALDCRLKQWVHIENLELKPVQRHLVVKCVTWILMIYDEDSCELWSHDEWPVFVDLLLQRRLGDSPIWKTDNTREQLPPEKASVPQMHNRTVSQWTEHCRYQRTTI